MIQANLQSLRKEQTRGLQLPHYPIALLSLLLLTVCTLPSFAQQQLKISDGQFSKKLPQIPSRNIEYVSDGVIVTYTESSKKKASALELTKQLPMVEENSIYDRIGIPLIKPKQNIQKAIPVQWSEPGKKLFILTNRALLPAANRLAEWKRCLGYDVFVSAAPSHRTSEQVKQVIQNRYDTEGIDYLLIIGDQDVITGKEYYANSGEVEETNTQWTPYYLSDHYYVCMDGDNDYFPDIHKGRIPSHNLEEAYNAVNKIIRYEKNPPSDHNFYKNGINLAQLQLLDPNSNTEYKETYRFIFTSENIRNYLIDNYNLNIERVYATHNTLTTLKPFKYNAQYCYDGVYNPNNIDVINYELMPDELQNLDVWKKTTEACGTFYPYLWNKPSFLFYSGHGDVDRWGCPGILVDPHLRKHGVFTVIKYPVMLFSICCQNGKYNLPNCFISEWINNKSGAVGAFAATHFTYILDQLAQVELMMNCIWPKDFINFAYGKYNRIENDYVSTVYPEKFPNGMTMGQVLDESINLVPNVTSYKNVDLNYHIKVTHYFGDPTMRWYIEEPGTFTPSHWESGTDIVFSGNRPETILAVYDTQTNEVTRHHNVDSLKINKEKAKHCVVTSVGYDIRPWSWIGEEVDLEVLSNQEIIKY